MKKKRVLCLILSALMIAAMLPSMAGAADISSTDRIRRIFVMGDSMAADYNRVTREPQMGWGQTLQNFFDESELLVVNRAKGGASSRNFYYDVFGDCWTTIWGTEETAPNYKDYEALLQKDDYVIFTFGANDVKKDGATSDEDQMTTTEEWLQRNADPTLPSTAEYVETDGVKTYSFKWYMRNYVELIRSRGAIPIIITPPERRVSPTSKEHAVPSTIAQYELAIQQLDTELNGDDTTDNDFICLTDISELTLKLYGDLGDTSTGSRKLFLHLAENQYPNYENGAVQADNTHFRDFGAVEISRIIVEELMKNTSSELDYLKSALKTVSTPFIYDSDHNTAGTAIKQTAEKVKGTTIYPRAQFINQGEATTIVPIVAGYDEDGMITNISMHDEIPVDAKSAVSFDIPYTMPDYVHSGKIKMFVWEKDTIIPLGNAKEEKFLAGGTSGNLLYETDFDDWTTIDTYIWKARNKAANNAYVGVGSLSGSTCLYVPKYTSIMSDGTKGVWNIPMGSSSDGTMETVFEADVKMGKDTYININNGATAVFSLYANKNNGQLYYVGATPSGDTYVKEEIAILSNPNETFHFKAVINEKEYTADVYINGKQVVSEKLMVGLIKSHTKYEKICVQAAGSKDTSEDIYVDNLTIYRQAIGSSK